MAEGTASSVRGADIVPQQHLGSEVEEPFQMAFFFGVLGSMRHKPNRFPGASLTHSLLEPQ